MIEAVRELRRPWGVAFSHRSAVLTCWVFGACLGSGMTPPPPGADAGASQMGMSELDQAIILRALQRPKQLGLE